jgi:capsular polysaccharide transport system permease protein
MAFVSGLMGPYMSPIPINSSMGMAISLAVAFIVTPWLAGKLMKSHAGADGHAPQPSKLDAKLDLRSHYSRPEHDLLSRLWDKATTQEQFHYYYLNRVSAEMDNYAGVLVVKAQGYDPATAHAIAAFLVAEGERFMDALARGLAQSQVDFLAQETQKMHAAVIASRDALLAFQNKHNLVSPKAATEATAATVSRLESQLADLETRRTALLGYLMPGSAGVAELNLQIDALGKQIASEKAKLTSPAGKTLNVTMEAYQRLEMDAQFAQDTYHAALSALEKGRIEAARTLKKMSVIQQPSLPEYSEEPRRLYNSTVFAALLLIVAGVVHLLAAIIRDHLREKLGINSSDEALAAAWEASHE